MDFMALEMDDRRWMDIQTRSAGEARFMETAVSP
jgi:hypothetical protein